MSRTWTTASRRLRRLDGHVASCLEQLGGVFLDLVKLDELQCVRFEHQRSRPLGQASETLGWNEATITDAAVVPTTDKQPEHCRVMVKMNDSTLRFESRLPSANVSVDRRRYLMLGSRHPYFRSRSCRPDIWRHRSATKRTRR